MVEFSDFWFLILSDLPIHRVSNHLAYFGTHPIASIASDALLTSPYISVNIITSRVNSLVSTPNAVPKQAKD